MCLAERAWGDVDTTTIQNCWHKVHILLLNHVTAADTIWSEPTVPILSLVHTVTINDLGSENNDLQAGIQEAEHLFECALDDLESTGALQHSNQMDLSEILNPTGEAHNLFKATDEEIFDAVMDT
ncbi:hypothetical protein J3R83DRAFT_11150 [Lanmaoa asiatica]|nr:hypothetical protein J3R83DRAFT_11150 [Lanmaoa asiatica]